MNRGSYSKTPWVDPFINKFNGRRSQPRYFQSFFDDVTRRLSWWSLLSAQLRRFHFRFSRRETRTHFSHCLGRCRRKMSVRRFFRRKRLPRWKRWKKSFRWKLSWDLVVSVHCHLSIPFVDERGINYERDKTEEKMIETRCDCVKDTSSQ